jgi:CheY-like chemotaxis protein
MARSFIKKRTAAVLTQEVRKMDKTSSARSPRIVIADDDPWVLKAISDQCSRMGFEVETAVNGLQVLIKAGQQPCDVLVIDVHMPEVDGLSVLSYLRDADKVPPRIIVLSGRVGKEVSERCEGLEVSCIHKGANFWNEFEGRLTGMFPGRAAAIKRAVRRSPRVELRKSPRVLLVDDDIGVKKMFFQRFAKLGAELIYAADATQGYWKARREQPTVIVADYCMPNGDAEYLLGKLRSTQETRSIPVIVQSGRRLNDRIKRRLHQDIDGQPGAARVLQKSFDPRELYEALQRLCGFAGTPDGGLLYE